MSPSDLLDKIREILPEATMYVDWDGEVLIATGLEAHDDELKPIR